MSEQRGAMVVDEIVRERIEALIFEHQRLRQGAEDFLQPVDEIEGQDRVDSVLLQAGIRLDLGDR